MSALMEATVSGQQQTPIEAARNTARKLDVIVKHFRVVAEDCNRRLRSAATFEAEMREEVGEFGCVTHVAAVDEEHAASEASRRLASLAGQVFAVPFARFQVDRSQLPALDPLDLWAWIEKRYGNGGAASDAYRPRAKEFVSTMHLGQGQEMRSVGGRLCFKKYIECSRGGSLEYYSARDLKIVMETLLLVGQWSDALTGEEMTKLRAVIEETRYLGRISFRRVEIGSAILIVPCMSSFDFRLSVEFAEKLQLFLSEFGGFS